MKKILFFFIVVIFLFESNILCMQFRSSPEMYSDLILSKIKSENNLTKKTYSFIISNETFLRDIISFFTEFIDIRYLPQIYLSQEYSFNLSLYINESREIEIYFKQIVLLLNQEDMVRLSNLFQLFMEYLIEDCSFIRTIFKEDMCEFKICMKLDK